MYLSLSYDFRVFEGFFCYGGSSIFLRLKRFYVNRKMEENDSTIKKCSRGQCRVPVNVSSATQTRSSRTRRLTSLSPPPTAVVQLRSHTISIARAHSGGLYRRSSQSFSMRSYKNLNHGNV